MKSWMHAGVAGALVAAACAETADPSPGGAGGSGGNDASSGAAGMAGAAGAAGGAAGSAGAAAAGAGGAAGSQAGAAGAAAGGGAAGAAAGAAGQAGSGGQAGAAGSSSDAGADAGWPTCDARPPGVPEKSIAEIWSDDPQAPTEVWIAGAYVTAVSGGGCEPSEACQIFLQAAETYASFAAGAQRAIKLRISGPAAEHFVGIVPGDRVDVLGHAWRYDLGGENELLVQVNSTLRGCAAKVGTGNPTPIAGVMLAELGVSAYEQTHGPLLVRVDGVSGKPAGAGEIFGLWPTGVGIGDAAPEDLVSLSPYFLAGHLFGGLSGDGGTTVDFASVTGVFGLFVPPSEAGSPPRYKVIYPRTMSDIDTTP
jgi:hypothetical protein